ncbi:TolC family protein (plasmid) [Catenovulum sp. SX2]|uniref:TolC family protein n=1 Tax=Catenovulum sp. SX2 TaxID=3398614 RepID=UPI003F863030
MELSKACERIVTYIGKPRIFASIVLSILLVACSQTPDTESRLVSYQLPNQWLNNQTSALSADEQRPLDVFPAELNELIAIALQNNHDLQLAIQRLNLTQADLNIQTASRVPEVNFSSGWSYNESSNALQQKSFQSRTSQKLRVAWEFDVWNKLTDLSNAANAEFEASQADYTDAQQSLVAQVIQAYLDVLLNKQLADLLTANLKNQQNRLTSITKRVDLGLAKPVDLYLAQTSLHNIETNLSAQQSRLEQSKQNLNILLGFYPSKPLELQLAPLNIQKFNLTLSPAEILTNRPDIRAAELRVSAAFSRWQHSSKAYLPSFKLAAELNASETSFKDIFNIQNWLARLAADITMPIFDAGQLEQIDYKNQTREQIAWLNYQKRVLSAMKEIESSLYAEYELVERKNFITQATVKISSAEHLLNSQYEQGIASSSEVFNIQSRRINSQIDLVRAEHAIISNRVTLTLALAAPFPLEVVSNDYK